MLNFFGLQAFESSLHFIHVRCIKGVCGYFVRRHYSNFGVIDGCYVLRYDIFFTTNKAIKVAIEKFLEDCVPVFAISDDENESICLVIGS